MVIGIGRVGRSKFHRPVVVIDLPEERLAAFIGGATVVLATGIAVRREGVEAAHAHLPVEKLRRKQGEEIVGRLEAALAPRMMAPLSSFRISSQAPR